MEKQKKLPKSLFLPGPTLQRKDGDAFSTSDETISRYIAGKDGTLLFGIMRYQLIIRGAASSKGLKPGIIGEREIAGVMQVFSFADVLRGLHLIYHQNTDPSAEMEIGLYTEGIHLFGYMGYMWAAFDLGEEWAKGLLVKMIIGSYIFSKNN